MKKVHLYYVFSQFATSIWNFEMEKEISQFRVHRESWFSTCIKNACFYTHAVLKCNTSKKYIHKNF